MRGRDLLLLLTLTTACSGGSGADATPRVLRLGADVDAETLDPRLMRNTTAYRVVNLIYDGLVELDASLEPRPSLARSWETPEDSVWIFHLRRGVRFHDGTTLTADDVVYTFESILDPATRARFRALYEPIASVVAADSLTVRMDLSEPYAPLLAYLDVGIVPRRYVEEGGDLSSAPVGTGPMRLASWARGTEIRLEPFEDHWRGPPDVDEFSFVIVADNTARAQAFEAGDLDIVQSPLSPQDVQRLAEDEGSRSVLTDGVAVTYLNFNVSVDLLAEPRLRRALSMMVDQRTIVDVIYEGVDRVATSVLLPGSWAYSDQVRQPTFDPAESRTLLAELGWRDTDRDGFLDRNGERLSVELSTHAEDPNRIQAVEFVQSTLRDNGVDARVSVKSWPAFFADVQEGRHEIALLGWTNIVDPDRLLYTQFVTGGDLNYGGYSNADVDRLLESARATLDRETRARAYTRAAQILAEEVPYFVLSYQGYQLFHRPGLVPEPDPRGYMRSVLGLKPGGP